jgi:hypothetical protein
MKAIILRVAAKDADSAATFPTITMADLPPLP